jgi:hypothetical protein
MTAMDIFLRVWYIIILGLPIAYLIYKSNRGQEVMGWSPEKQMLIAEGLIYLLTMYLIQTYVFKDTLFFIISAPVWLVLFSVLIYFLLSSNDIYVLESTIQNELFYNLGKVEKLYSPETRQRLLVMDRGIYDCKTHVGDSHYTLWAGSPRIKFTDYYDDKEGIFFHPEVPELHNISFYNQRAFWLQLKEDLPKVMRDNVKYTWLSDYKLAHEQRVTEDNFRLLLKNLKDQYKHEPFHLGHDIEEIFERLRKEKLSGPRQSEEAPVSIEQAKAKTPEPAQAPAQTKQEGA